jgi:hypothetical protein
VVSLLSRPFRWTGMDSDGPLFRNSAARLLHDSHVPRSEGMASPFIDAASRAQKETAGSRPSPQAQSPADKGFHLPAAVLNQAPALFDQIDKRDSWTRYMQSMTAPFLMDVVLQGVV